MKLDEQPIKAFPHSRPVINGQWSGMDLRDYFAAKAMQSLISDPNLDVEMSKIAELSYEYAKKMMKAREQ